MKNTKIISTLIAALMLTAVVGCTTGPKTQTVGAYVDDAVVTTNVKAAILKEPTLKSAEINVETYKGAVQLTGFVNSRADIATAVAVTRGVNGVKSVKNDMLLK